MKLINHKQVRVILEAHYPDLRHVWLFDKEYCAVGKEEFENNILPAVNVITTQFKDELFDCDDYAHVTSAFVKLVVAKLYPKSATFGEIAIKHAISKEVHSLNFLVTEDDGFHYFEPQGRIFVNGKNYKPFFVKV